MRSQAGSIGYLGCQTVALSLGRGDPLDLSGGIAPGGKDGHLLALHDLELNPQMHLDSLPVKIKGLLGNHFGPDGKILLSLFDCCTAEIAQMSSLKVFGKPLQSLFIPPRRTDTVDAAVDLVVMSSLAQGDLLGDGMLSLGSYHSINPVTIPATYLSTALVFDDQETWNVVLSQRPVKLWLVTPASSRLGRHAVFSAEPLAGSGP